MTDDGSVEDFKMRGVDKAILALIWIPGGQFICITFSYEIKDFKKLLKSFKVQNREEISFNIICIIL